MPDPLSAESSTRPGAEDAFPKRLRAARELRAISASELGRQCRLPGSSISHFEAGARKPSFANLAKLASALSVSTDFLLGRADDPSPPAVADVLFRRVQTLSDADRALTEDFVRMLADRGTPKNDDQA